MLFTAERRKQMRQFMKEEVRKFERLNDDVSTPALHPYIKGLLFTHAREIGLMPLPNFLYDPLNRIDMVWYNHRTKSMEAAFEVCKAVNPISIKKLLHVDADHKYLISCGECSSWRFRSATKMLQKQSKINHLGICVDSS